MGMREIKVTMIEYQVNVTRHVYLYVHSVERGLLFYIKSPFLNEIKGCFKKGEMGVNDDWTCDSVQSLFFFIKGYFGIGTGNMEYINKQIALY
jgi:hypothetical protein